MRMADIYKQTELVQYFYDTDKYLYDHGDDVFTGPGTFEPVFGNIIWLTFPIVEVYSEPSEVLRVLYDDPHYDRRTRILRDDYSEHVETFEQFMLAGPIAFVNRMKAWPGSKTLGLYKDIGDGWFDTMMERAYIASAYLGHESNPVPKPKPKPKPKVVQTGNVIKVNFGARRK